MSTAEQYRLRIEGLQEALRRNQQRVLALRPDGVVDREIHRITLGAQRYAMSITHVDTGALRLSHRAIYAPSQGRVHLSPSTRNPRTGKRPWEYGVYEHDRGGEHAFYTRTKVEYGVKTLRYSKGKITKALKEGRAIQ